MNQPTRSFLVLLAASVFMLALPAYSSVIYVKPTGSDGSSGTTWASAKKTVQAAINAAVSGDEIWVAAGTYTGNVAIKSGVGLYGGFAGTETHREQRNWTQNVTILDGSDNGSVVTVPPEASGATVIDGFTIRNGSAVSGGGIHCQSGSPKIQNNKITDNFAELDGGGIYCGGGSAVIANNTIIANTASAGGGIQCSGSASPTITANVIKDNTAFHYGGGICCSDNAFPVISSNDIKGNSADFGGGAAFTDNATPIALSNLLTNNSAFSYGGALYNTGQSSAKVLNNTMVANSAMYEGAGVCCDWSSYPTVANNIIAFGSSGIYKKGSGSPTFKNNCVTGNTGYNYSGLSVGVGDIDADPLFINMAGNYHLQPGSPCLDKGDDGVIQAGWLDIDGQQRIYGVHVDIGADEAMPPAPVNTSLSPGSGPLAAGTKQTITSVHSDPDGHADLTWCLLLINSAFTGENAVYLYYDAASNRLHLRDDGDITWGAGAVPGSAVVLENSMVKLYCAETTVLRSGSSISINWMLEFKSAMSGKVCPAWMKTRDTAGLMDEWEQMCSYSIGQATGGPVNTSLSPSSGPLAAGTKQTITSVHSDPDGHADLTWCLLLINSAFTGENAVYLYYDAANNRLHLRDDGDITWGAGAVPGSATVLENSMVKLYCAETTVSRDGTNLAIGWRLEFKSAMSGKVCPAWMKTRDTTGLMDEWEQMCIYSIGQATGGPVNTSLSPSSGPLAAGTKQSITSVHSDPDGHADLTWCLLLINSAFTGENAVYLYYDAANDRLHLRDDWDTTWGAGAVPGSAVVLENSMVKLYCAETTVSRSGSNISINWRLEFKSAMSGKVCPAWMKTRDTAGLMDEWEQMCIYSIGQATGGPVNTSLSPSSGPLAAGTKQSITSVHSDPDGHADLTWCLLLINSAFTGENAVYLYYDAANDRLHLRDEADTTWGAGAVPGSATVLENSMVKLYCAETTVLRDGSNISINWRLEFKSTMSGKVCPAWMKTRDTTGLMDEWEPMGTYTVL